jgi:hypothetical protein
MSVVEGNVRIIVNGHEFLSNDCDFDSSPPPAAPLTVPEACWHGTLQWSSPLDIKALIVMLKRPTRRQLKQMLVRESLERRQRTRRNGYWRLRNKLLREYRLAEQMQVKYRGRRRMASDE